MNILKSLGILAFSATISLSSFAQDGRSSSMKDGKMSSKDSKVVSDIMAMNSYELKLMEMAQIKAQHEGLKDAVAHMIDDHRRMDDEMRQYADEHGYMKAADKGEKFAEKMGKWEKKRAGQEWDSDITEELVDINKDGLDMMQDARHDVKDETLIAWMNNAIPVMQQHMELLTPLKEKVKKPWKDGHKDAKSGTESMNNIKKN